MPLVSSSLDCSPYHEATGEFIWSRFYRNNAEKILEKEQTAGKTATIYVSHGAVSKMVGQKRENEIYLKEKFSLCGMKVRESDEISLSQIKIKLEERKNSLCD